MRRVNELAVMILWGEEGLPGHHSDALTICIVKPPALLCQRLIVAQQQYVSNMETSQQYVFLHCGYYLWLPKQGTQH